MNNYRTPLLKKLFISIPKSVIKLIIFPKRYIDPSKTYYPEFEHKSFFSCFWDQLVYALHYGYNNEEYYIYGLDIIGSDNKQRDFIPEYFNIDNLLYQNRNYVSKESKKFSYYNYLCILRDKWVFSKIMEGVGFPIPRTVGLIFHGHYIPNGGHDMVPLSSLLLSDNDLLAKPISGNGGKGICHLVIKNSMILYNNKPLSEVQLEELFKDNIYILQEYIHNQHPAMIALYAGSINTLRITLATTNNTIQLLGVMCLMGARGAEYSNWHFGGVCVNVNIDGKLDKYGFSFFDKRITHHPDSGTIFEGYQIPYFKEAILMAKQAMNIFYGLKTIGFDIAITENGPVFIEGNDGWGIAAHQMVENSGWANSYKKLFE